MLVAVGCGGARLVSDGLPGEEDSRSEEVVVERVTDGDTVEVRPAPGGVEDVRLIGMDAPELFGPSGPQPYATEATRFAERALEGRRVTLEFDVERTDQYGRLLAYVYGRNGAMFNEALLLEGYAQVATFPPNTRYEDRFEAAQGRAREARRGIWGLEEGKICRLADRGNGIGGGC
jgi:micrococcal nuclease